MNVVVSLALLVAGILVFGAALIVPSGRPRLLFATDGSGAGAIATSGSAPSGAASDRGEGDAAERAPLPSASAANDAPQSSPDPRERVHPPDRDGGARPWFDGEGGFATAAGARRPSALAADLLARDIAYGAETAVSGAPDGAVGPWIGSVEAHDIGGHGDVSGELAHSSRDGDLRYDGLLVAGRATESGRPEFSAMLPTAPEAAQERGSLRTDGGSATAEGLAHATAFDGAGFVDDRAAVGPARQLMTSERCVALLDATDIAIVLDAAYELRLRFGGAVLEEILMLAVPAERAATIRAALPPESAIASYS